MRVNLTINQYVDSVNMAAKRQNPIHYAGDLRADLMAEALRVIAEDGTSAVSLRALTRNLGVSHAAPKNHFATKEALFAEIAREGFVLFESDLTEAAAAARDGGAGPLDILEALGLAYLRFAERNASHFALMFRTDLFDVEVIANESAAAFAVLEQAVLVAQADGWHSDAAPHNVATLLWSTVHGHAHLEAQNMPIGANPEDRLAVLRLLMA